MFGKDLIGRPISDVETPALVVDADVMEANIAEMGKYFDSVPAWHRPHAKTHKSPIIAHKQINAGAVGITCAKLGEAEVLFAGGIQDILIANELIGAQKIARLVRLARHATITVAVDHEQNAIDISEAAVAAGSTIRILVEINVGQNRCGVEPGPDVVELVKKIDSLPNLEFYGFNAYEGHLVMHVSRDERVQLVKEAMAPMLEARELVENAGFEVKVVSGGGTGTYDITSQVPGFNELQPGSYVFMDATYSAVEGPDTTFAPGIYLWSTMISRPVKDRGVLDIGLKTVTPEYGVPKLLDVSGATVNGLSDEHAKVTLEGDALQLKIGDKVRLQPGHVCTTVNLHDTFVVVRKGIVEALWPVAGRGRSQ
jgi:D-serine deaminase-like pyridoxal phosphate-dependent protein